LFPGVNCNGISCVSDCNSDYKQSHHILDSTPELLFHLQNSTFNVDSNAKEFYKSQSRVQANRRHLEVCCSLCKENCTAADGSRVEHKSEWMKPDDPCTTFVCYNGRISEQISSCSGLICPKEFQIRRSGDCCNSCDPNWASFCPEDEDCDIACQFGFVIEQERGCNICKCARKIPSTTSSTTTASTATESSSSAAFDNDATRTVPFYFYLNPTDEATQNLFIFVCAFGVVLVACLAAIGFYFHRRVYKKVPLLNMQNSSSA
jgi:hypothetical protein